MNWLFVILIVAVIGGIIGYLNTCKSEDAVAGAVTAGMGCGYIILQIFIAMLGIALLFAIGGWLFG